MTIVFIALQLSQPRCIKRIKAIYDAGFKVKVYGFDSGLYNESLKSLPFPVERIINRDKDQGKLKKVVSFASHVKRIFRENSKNDLFYFFGYEIASIAFLLGCKNYVYEEADVTAARAKRSLVRNMMVKIDRSIIMNSYRTVLTSGGFAPYIFSDRIPNEKIILLPNKLSPYFNGEKKEQIQKSEINVNHIRFSFIGLIRYPNTIVRFAKIIGREFPEHEFHFWGQPEREDYLDDEVKRYNNVFMHGKFKNPDDLMSIYKQTDISIVCYDTTSGNVRIAEPNKIYESIYFETPIVVSSGTFLAERVKELGVGYDINASNDLSITQFVKGIDIADLHTKIENMKAIPWQEVVDDSTDLIEVLSARQNNMK